MAFVESVVSSVRDLKTPLVVFVAAAVTVKIVMSMNKKKYNLPPGPRGLPLFGYLPFFGQEPPVTFDNMRKTYGDVISISLGSWPAVVIQGRDVIKEALVTKGDDFSGRPAFTTARSLNEGRNFAFSLFGPLWKAHRKIVSNVLYNFSNSRNNPIEAMICGEAETVAEEFLAHGDRSFCPMDPLRVASSSMVYQLCFGTHLNIRQDADFMSALSDNFKFQRFTRAGNPVDVMPWLRYVIPGQVSKMLEFLKKGYKRRGKKVEEHEAAFDPDSLRDITDGLIHAGNSLRPEEKNIGLDKRRVVESLDTIMGAGGGTVTTALQWFVILMAKHPEIQERLFREIDRVVGPGRAVLLSDRPSLALVEAAVNEVLRYSCAIAFALPHATTCDTTLRGYDIPRGTVVMVNLYSIFMDEELWGDPHTFRPERFITTEGELDKGLVEQVAAFSLGRRRCAGEFLARTELFLFCSTILQKVRFYKPAGHPGYTLASQYGLAHDLLPVDVCVAPRV